MKKRNDGRYRRYITIDGKRKAFYGTSQREVNEKIKEYLLTQEEKKDAGEKFSVVAEDWYWSHEDKVSPTTRKSYRAIYNKAVEQFGDMYIADITIRQISAYVNSLEFSRKTMRNHLSVISQIFEHGIIYYGLTENPCDHIRITSGKPSTKRRALTEEETEIVKQSLNAPGGLFAYTLLYTGLRRGEILALQYKDIDREAKLIHVTKSAYYVGNRPQIKTPKTESGVRDVILLPELERVLPKGKPSNYIFSNDGKEPYSDDQARTLWENYCKATGLTVTPHYLRHNYATILFKSGVDVKTAQYLLGHSDIHTTMNIYTHLQQSMLEERAKKIVI